MQRDDSVLNTGLSSALTRRRDAKLKQEQRDRDMMRSILTPSAEIILEWIAQEQQAVEKLNYTDLLLDTDVNIRAQLLARQLHSKFLTKLGNRAKATLRTAKKAEHHD